RPERTGEPAPFLRDPCRTEPAVRDPRLELCHPVGLRTLTRERLRPEPRQWVEIGNLRTPELYTHPSLLLAPGAPLSHAVAVPESPNRRERHESGLGGSKSGHRRWLPHPLHQVGHTLPQAERHRA